MKKRHRYLRDLQRNLTPVERLNRIVTDGMCIGCGLCESIAGQDRIQMRLVQNLTERPVITGELDDEIVDQIYRLCSGTRVEGLPEGLTESDSQYDRVWGVWRRLALAWAAEPKVRHQGSTGGVLTALALYLLEQGEVDWIVHARPAQEFPAFGEPTISRTRTDVMAAAGSRYGPTATLRDIQNILDRAESGGKTFAFIGTPCDVTTLRNLAREDPRVDRLCHYQLTMVCGGFLWPLALRDYLRKLGVEWENLATLRYRGYGCPGPTRITTRDGRVLEKNYLDFWGEEESSWQIPFRCRVCADGIGDAADIAAADTWDGGVPAREGQEEDPGCNAVLARSRRGEELLARAETANYVVSGAELVPRDLDRMQPHQVTRKLAVWSRFVGMRSAGRIVPDVSRLRLKSLARLNSMDENLRQARGARNRCLSPDHRESLPSPQD